MTYDFVSGDTGSKLRVTIIDSETSVAINLTGATVSLKWMDQGGVLKTKTMSLVAPYTNGIAEYQFAAGELFAPKMRFEVSVVDIGGKEITGLDLIEIVVREQMA